MQSKRQFFHKGVGNQRSADITIDLKRPDSKKIKEWSTSQKIIARAFIADSEKVFKSFRKEILKNL